MSIEVTCQFCSVLFLADYRTKKTCYSCRRGQTTSYPKRKKLNLSYGQYSEYLAKQVTATEAS